MVLASGYIMFRTPKSLDAAVPFEIPNPIQAEGIERNAHKNISPDSTKYFSEPGGSYELMHYDTRYFQKELKADERQTVLEDLIRSYLNVTNHYGIETWLAHGTLMGWWWGGRIMPWDSDIDVQLSFETLDSIAPELNFTEYRYEFHHADGQLVSKSYLLDINPYYNEVGMGDGNNVIDARWIDTHSGMYVDITAVRRRDDSGKWSCKDRHQYEATDLWPLREAEFEGAKALVPAKATALLRDEYGQDSTEREEFMGYVVPSLKMM
ncbi:mannosylphosphate transferase [Metarhizium acridum CQMa 102]|uniref:Mannosylphosphate transferase n=1 Tax=Metarhizium acridum (strain CQMa 102) TaxID=655827 RepID=E9DV18_METAQ|nr:mannosylphosphate transferase [Metarhizium acridum CQMa 102]EFY92442.1 mannosylphosphate transferase [Metarhizium acridum CQMa 102]